VDVQGNLVQHVGDPDFVTFLRSAAKPFQALPLVESGAADAFGLTQEELALCCGSHGGEPRHVRVVEGIFAKAGVSADLLRCGTHPLWSKAAKEGLAGGKPTPKNHNCSGKHAGMMALQKHLGADPADYLDPKSPAQQAILAAVARTAGLDLSEVRTGTDGCSVPNFAVPLRAGARMFARLAAGEGKLARLRDVMMAHPENVGGSERFDTDLMGAADERLVTKAGAEGVQGVGDTATGMGLLLKVEDGASRAVAPATVEALRQLAWLEGRAFEVLGDWWRPAITNWSGRLVGETRPVLRLNP
jgi:L-asparaginase II